MKTEYTEEEIEHLYNKHFRNVVFDVQHTLQNLQTLYAILAGERTSLLDKYIVVERDLQLARANISALIRDMQRIDEDFRSTSSIEDAKKRGVYRVGKSDED